MFRADAGGILFLPILAVLPSLASAFKQTSASGCIKSYEVSLVYSLHVGAEALLLKSSSLLFVPALSLVKLSES